MEKYTEIDDDTAHILLNIDYRDPVKVFKRLKEGESILLPSITGHELRMRDGKIILYTHS